MEIKFYKRDFLLKISENKFLHSLKAAVGEEYDIFPQIHMYAFVDTHSDKALWRMVMQFSVDFPIYYLNYFRDNSKSGP